MLKFFASLLILPVLASSSPNIVITKIAAFEKSGYEWVEIYNRSDEAVNTEGWKFYEGETNHGWKLAQGGDLILSPGEKAAIVQDKNKFLENYSDYTDTIIDSSWGSLKEAGEEIGLKDANLEVVEVFSYIPCPDNILEKIDLNLDDYTENNWKEKMLESGSKNQEASNENQELGIAPESSDRVGNQETRGEIENLPIRKIEESVSQTVKDNQTNNDGLILDSKPLIQVNTPPVAVIGDDLEINVGGAIFFDGADSFDEDGDELEYFWDFGDGEEGEGIQIEHEYLHSGKFSAILRVFDGKITASNAIWIKVNKIDYPKEIYINAALPNPAGPDTANEWVEICSNESQFSDLSGWILDDIADGGSKAYVIEDFGINSKECVKFYRGQTRIAINNDKDSVRLLNPYKEIIDEMSFDKKMDDDEIIYHETWNPLSPKASSSAKVMEDKSEGKHVFDSEGLRFERETNPDKKLGATYVIENDDNTESVGVPASAEAMEGKQNFESQDTISQENLPMAVRTGDVEKGNLSGEIVKIAGVITEKSGNTFFIDDGSGILRIQILPKTKIKYSQFLIGDQIIITGIVSKTEVGYRVTPEKIEI